MRISIYGIRRRAGVLHDDVPFGETKQQRMARKRAHRRAKAEYRAMKFGFADIVLARRAIALSALGILAALAAIGAVVGLFG